MTLRVNNNIAAINSKRHLTQTNRMLNTRLERLSSGLKLNKAADDAAGLSMREGMRAEISGLRVNVSNAEQATNLIQVAEGSLNEVNAILIRMRELAIQSSSSTATDLNRESIQAEFNQLTSEIDRIAQATQYNNQALLTGFGNQVDSDSSTALTTSNETGVTALTVSGAGAGTYVFADDASDGNITLGNGTVTQTMRVATMLDGENVATGSQIVANFDRLGIQVTLAGPEVGGATGDYTDGDLDGTNIVVEETTGGSFQVGPTDGAFNRIEVSIDDMSATGAKLNMATAAVATISSARAAITTIDEAISTVSQQRGDLGAYQNRLAFTIGYTENGIENIQASEATISDADVASEVTAFTRAQILSQAATAMLAQANVMPQSALALLN